MPLNFSLLSPDHAPELAAFDCASFGTTPESALKNATRRLREGKVLVALRRNRIIASLCLTNKKPWAIDASYFTPVRLPIYLLGMAVAPSLQRQGIGRLCLLEVEKIAAAWPAQAIRLDAYDRPGAAGEFYQRCGYREVGRAVYRQTPLIYYERLIEPTDAT